jgi:hypothetical protein
MPRSLTLLANRARNKELWRILCVGCAGVGGDPLSDTCPFCEASPSKWCHQHRCPICSGRGVVCPECRGMRFHSSGMGDMVPTNVRGPEYHQMVNLAIKHCPKCMHTMDGKSSLSVTREADVIVAYIADPHNAYWSVRDEQDRQRAEWEAMTRETKPWRRDWGKQRALVKAAPIPVDVVQELATISKSVWPKVWRDNKGMIVQEG